MERTIIAQIEDLKPTQGALGLEHARVKLAITRACDEGERARFMLDHALRVVRGPDGKLHVIDHHHWARAWFEFGMDEVPVEVTCNFSALSSTAFTTAMHSRGWLHPYNECGRRTAVEEMPDSISAMPDDPYQSIAAFVRTAGVFRDSPPFNAKFAWADYFRRRVIGDFYSISGFAKALADAIRVSRDADARGLPGSIA